METKILINYFFTFSEIFLQATFSIWDFFFQDLEIKKIFSERTNAILERSKNRWTHNYLWNL